MNELETLKEMRNAMDSWVGKEPIGMENDSKKKRDALNWAIKQLAKEKGK